jgi:hypothetical protein
VVRYFAVTAICELTYASGGMELRAYYDADHAGDVDLCHSMMGYVSVMHGGAVIWSSNLQPMVAALTIEAGHSIVEEAALATRQL